MNSNLQVLQNIYYHNSEREFLGWERKRGLLNQFNEYLAFGNNSDFIINTLENSKFDKKIKYPKSYIPFPVKIPSKIYNNIRL